MRTLQQHDRLPLKLLIDKSADVTDLSQLTIIQNLLIN